MAPEETTSEHSEEEVGAALSSLLQPADEPGLLTETESEETRGKETESEEPEAEEQAPPADELEVLRGELEAAKAEADRLSSTLRAVQTRSADSVARARNQALSKSALADRARQILSRAMTSEDGVDKAEVEGWMRDVQGSLNPQSANYQRPVQAVQPTDDDATIAGNEFLNAYGLDDSAASDFRNWLYSDACTLNQMDRQITDTYGFLSNAYGKYSAAAKSKPKAAEPDTVRAVKSVQRTQRAAARAVNSVPATTNKQSLGQPKQVKAKDLTDEQLSELMRQAVDEVQ